MISYVAKVISFCATTLQNIVLIASCIGELIITSVLWITTILSNLSGSLMKFFQIVYEDNASIFIELPDSLKIGLDNVSNQLLHLQNVVEAVYLSFYSRIVNVVSSAYWVVNSLYVVVSEVLILVINTLILMGESVWLVVTFLPIHVPLLLRSVFKYVFNSICDVIVNGYMKLLRFTNYLTEVPLESFMGIVSAIIIVRLCIHFNETIVRNITSFYWFLTRNVRYLYHMAYNYFTNTEVHTITRLASGDLLSASDSRDGPVDIDDINGVESLCVICQERQKTVLTLPCRHICLCAECCRRLYGYQRTCPICRTFIYHSVTVYW